jgi:hypothetical protein
MALKDDNNFFFAPRCLIYVQSLHVVRLAALKMINIYAKRRHVEFGPLKRKAGSTIGKRRNHAIAPVLISRDMPFELHSPELGKMKWRDSKLSIVLS